MQKQNEAIEAQPLAIDILSVLSARVKRMIPELLNRGCTMKFSCSRLVFFISLLTVGSTTWAASMTIGSGNTVALGSAQVSLGCADLSVAGTLSLGTNSRITDVRSLEINTSGTLNGGSGIVYVSGNWNNIGTFVAEASTVVFSDGCDNTIAGLSGDSSFWNVQLSTATGRQYSLAAGSTQTVLNTIGLVGLAGNLLLLRSSVDCAPAYINNQGLGTINFINVDCIEVLSRTLTASTDSVIGPNSRGFGFEDDGFLNILLIIKSALDQEAAKAPQ